MFTSAIYVYEADWIFEENSSESGDAILAKFGHISKNWNSQYKKSSQRFACVNFPKKFPSIFFTKHFLS